MGWLINEGWKPGLSCDVAHQDRWHGTDCAGSTILRLELVANGLQGTIPTELGQLRDLRALSIESNPLLSGSIPSEIGALQYLRSLSIHNNTMLSGSVPPELESLGALRFLSMHSSSLSGTVPEGPGLLSRVRYLDISHNSISGSVPAPARLKSIEYFSVHNNQLSGTLPAQIGSLDKLLDRFYAQKNQISGFLPTELGNLTRVPIAALNENSLSGTLPTELGSLAQLRFPSLSYNRMSGTTPSELTGGNWSTLQARLDLASNLLNDAGEQSAIDARIIQRQQILPTGHQGGQIPDYYARQLATTAQRAAYPWYEKLESGACEWRSEPDGRFQCSMSSSSKLPHKVDYHGDGHGGLGEISAEEWNRVYWRNYPHGRPAKPPPPPTNG